ncbi:MAG: hypothetical protein JSU04_18840 [Bdellovibrionales bacterium]|nr:hypothetical protein [Bdellovibrionales bacterium]
MGKYLFMLILSGFAANAAAQGTSSWVVPVTTARWTYDVGAAVGTDQLGNYTEIQIGANWHQNQWLAWRNALFTRFGNNYDSIFGLDTSIRGEMNLIKPGSNFGVQLYAAPGARFATRDSSAGFLEAGVTLKLASLYVGGAVKQFYYMQDRQDRFGRDLPNEETQTSLILSGGGTF